MSACLVGALALAGTATVTWLCGVPDPAVPDEFSYLLAADTFAHGRLTNPTHPMWVHFESLHIIQQPTYTSKYPPAQGLALAAGQATLGLPIAGVWLSAGLACGALTWMLAGWMPGRWALAGGLLGVMHHLTTIWSQSYWGGLVAVCGGALLVGAFGRLVRRRPRARHAVVLGLGLGVLANTRPYEGLILSVPLLIALAVWVLRRHGPPVSMTVGRILAPLGGVLLLVAAGMLWYNHRTTGDPLTMPYIVHQRSYMPIPLVVFQAPPPPTFRHDRLARAFGTSATVRTLTGLATVVHERATEQAHQFFGAIPILAALVALLPLERNRWYHLAVLTLVLFTVGVSLNPWMWSHYVAPAVGLALLVTMRSMRRASLWRPGGVRLGRPLVAAAWAFMAASLACGSWDVARSLGHRGWAHTRAEIAYRLGRTSANHLVMVRYAPRHHVGTEWIYNAADIDAAPVVWAADMDPAANAALFDYFRDRQIWLLEPDLPEIRLVPYPVTARASTGAP